MSCHSQIWTNSPLLEPVRESYRNDTPITWNLVNKVPEFVYFNHSIHVNRGVNCNNCHGPVQKMMLTYKGNSFQMKWCLECHRNPEKYLYRAEDSDKRGLTPREQVFDTYWKYQEGEEKLSRRERALMNGTEYTPSTEELDKGKELIKQYGVKKQQLADCGICHR
jgi:formate-dependent nitrite reductase cytochrome c552 subunit